MYDIKCCKKYNKNCVQNYCVFKVLMVVWRQSKDKNKNALYKNKNQQPARAGESGSLAS